MFKTEKFRLDEVFISDYDFIGAWNTVAVPSNLRPKQPLMLTTVLPAWVQMRECM